MTKTSTVVWTLIGLVVLVLGILGAIYGPEMYREGRAIVGPIVDIAQSENRLASLNTELPFEESVDGVVPEDRFSTFLDIRRDLMPHYLDWQDMVRQLEQHQAEDWKGAKEALAAIQTVMTIQIETLKAHGMSPAEFVWIEDLAYLTWAPGAEEAIASSAGTEMLKESTMADAETLADLESRFGSSRATREFAAVLDRRLQSLDNPGPPKVEGVADMTSALFWDHREELLELDLARYSELHDILRGNNSVNITIDTEDE